MRKTAAILFTVVLALLVIPLQPLGFLWLAIGEAALLAILFHVAYVLGTLITVLRGIRLPDCGCFGILFVYPLNWMMVFEGAAFAFLCLGLYQLTRSKRTTVR